MQYGVTLLIAAKDGTDKAIMARKTKGCVLVKPAWLVECYWSLTRRDVKPHLMDPAVVETQLRQEAIVESIVDDSNLGTDSSESDDDDFAIEFENELMNSQA